MEATPLERDIFSWIAERNPALASALDQPAIARRKRAGAFFTYLVEGDSDWDRPPVDGPTIRTSRPDVSGGSILWLAAGRPACLEVYTTGANFNEELEDYELLDLDPTV
jgi:hypothetical protein